jgi:hypothetical protein
MRVAHAIRLARLASRRRPDGTLTGRAVRAWERLAAEAHDHTVRNVLLAAWLADPHEDTWEHVGRWCTPADVHAAAVDPARTAGSRAALGAYCTRNGLVPDNPVERAVFYVLTGDQERYQAADPDGTLLAGAYRNAAEATREALRHTMVGAGELDLVRVIADRPDRPLTAAEAGYLARQLADAGEWARLWRLVPAMPLAAAMGAARRFIDWRPDDDAGRAYLTHLARTDPDVLAALGAAAVTLIRNLSTTTFSFAPDGTEIAVRHRRGTKVFALPGGDLVATHPGSGYHNVTALGGATIVYTDGPKADYPVIRRAPDRPAETLIFDAPGAKYGRTSDGFVVDHRNVVYFGRASGPWTRTVGGPLSIASRTAARSMIAADPVSGNLAFRVFDDGGRDLVLVDAELRVLASSSLDGPGSGAFCGPEQLVLWHWGEGSRLELWQRDGSDLVRTAGTALTVYMTPAVAPGRVVVRRTEGLVWLDSATLTPVAAPPGFPAVDSSKASFSPDGTLLAVATDRGVDVHDLPMHQLTELTRTPLSQARLTDLETVAALAERQLTPGVGEVLALLRAGLEYRFGAEVALGPGTRVAGGADDIALGGR